MSTSHCLGCGQNLEEVVYKRLLKSEASRHIIPLWTYLSSQELQGGERTGISLVNAGGKMCRKCFGAYDRCTKLMDTLKTSLCKAAEVLHGSLLDVESPPLLLAPPPPKRAAVSLGPSSASPEVSVQLNYPKKARNYNLTPSRKKVGKAVARGSKKAVIRECMKDPVMQKYTIQTVGRQLHLELASMCSEAANSILREQSSDAICEFSWGKVHAELQAQAPTFLSLLEICTHTRKPRPNRMGVIGMCAVLLLKYRFAKMSLVQKVVSLLLYAGHSGKQVFQRLQKLNICMSHQVTTTLVNTLGRDHDVKVIQWRNSLLEELGSTEEEQLPHGALVHCATESSDEESQSDSSISAPSFSPILSIESLTSLESDMETDDEIERDQEEITPVHNQLTSLDAIPEVTSSEIASSGVFGYKLVGDNIDITVKARYMRLEGHQNQSLHFFHSLAVRDRVNFGGLCNHLPATCNNSPLNIALSMLPSAENDKNILNNIATLISRVIVTHMSFFQFAFSDVVTWHIKHKFYSEMSKKSEVVPLGILLKNENKGSDMVEILSHLHQYVPVREFTKEVFIPSVKKVVTKQETVLRKILFGGDQLTAARARGAIKAMSNASTAAKRLEGIIPVSEDWHAEVAFLGVIWKFFYSIASAREHTTLYQLRNLINRTNVVKKPKANFNACDDFFEIIITAHILAAALQVLGMRSLNDTPSEKIVPSPEMAWMETDDERRTKLHDISKLIARKFINVSFNSRTNLSTGDGVHDYSRHLLSIGCLYFEMRDAIKEGDGKRVLQCWQYLLPVFHNSGRKNYTMEAFHFLYQYQYGLPPRLAEQLMWSRFINTQGIGGKNIPLDLHLEHLNRVCKTGIEHLGANKTDDAIVRCGKALGTMYELLQQFDSDNSVSDISGAHQKPSYKRDLNIIVHELQQCNVFTTIPGRAHSSFKKPTNIIHAKPAQNSITWIMEHLPR